MREYCPLCEKNGIKTRIKCYQINWEEAIFMCSSVECPWPMELEDTLIIQRSVKVYKTQAALEDVAKKYFKKEDDPINGYLSSYTPPQTPEIVFKDAATVSQVPCPATVPVCTSTSLDVIEDIVFNTDNVLIDVSKPCDIGTNNPNIKITVGSVKPKLVGSKPVNYKDEKLPTKGYVFKDSNSLHSKTNVQLKSKNQNVCTSLVDSSVVVKNKLCDSRLVDKVKPKRRVFPKFKSKTPLQKFTFEDYVKKNESTKVKTDGDIAVSEDVIKNENNVSTGIKLHTETIQSIDNLISKVSLLNSSSSDNKLVDSSIIFPDVKDCQDDVDLEFDQFFAENNINISTKENLVEQESATTNQSDIDSIFNSLSKGSEGDQHNLDIGDSDLDELHSYFDDLGQYSETLNGALKSSDNKDDCEWPFS